MIATINSFIEKLDGIPYSIAYLGRKQKERIKKSFRIKLSFLNK